MSDWWHNADFGDVPTWLAFAGAGVATLFAGRLLAIEARREKRLELAGRQEQANKVAAWLEGRDDGDIDVIVRNASDLPVYRLTAYMYELEHHSLLASTHCSRA